MYSPEENKLILEFKENAFKSVLTEIKHATSNMNKANLNYTFKKYGWTGPFTYLCHYYSEDPEDMLDALYLLWDEVD